MTISFPARSNLVAKVWRRTWGRYSLHTGQVSIFADNGLGRPGSKGALPLAGE
ncbi:hypothetical protein MTCOM_02960 [Moorella thermoacetica]